MAFKTKALSSGVMTEQLALLLLFKPKGIHTANQSKETFLNVDNRHAFFWLNQWEKTGLFLAKTKHSRRHVFETTASRILGCPRLFGEKRRPLAHLLLRNSYAFVYGFFPWRVLSVDSSARELQKNFRFHEVFCWDLAHLSVIDSSSRPQKTVSTWFLNVTPKNTQTNQNTLRKASKQNNH